MARTRPGVVWLALALAWGASVAAGAQEMRPGEQGAPMASSSHQEGADLREPGRLRGEPEPPGRQPEDHLVVTRHKAVIGGQETAYTATTGTLVLRTEEGRAKASAFFIAYTRDGQDAARRPVTFTYNGGPGSSSVWLHMGAFGPRRVAMDDEGMAPPPPYRLADNGESLLDLTDLVFIDPVSTGFSRPAPGEKADQFHGVREDVAWVGEFIRLYTERYGRWMSPKFLAGESYGTTRSAALSLYLQERFGMYLNGIVLVSSILDFATDSFDTGNDLPYVTFLPSFTAAAWYHKRLPPDLQADLQKALAESERFALGDYTLALALGTALPADRQRQVASHLARLTGLSEDYIERANLRPTEAGFVKELLRSERLTIGRIDSRYTGADRAAIGETDEYDPSMAATRGVFAADLNAYLRGELGFHSDLPYELLTDRVQPWNMGISNSYLSVTEDLRKAMAQNTYLRVFVASGYFDLATPYFGTRYTFSHLGYDPGYAERVTMAYYQAGHMLYIRRADREKLKADLAAFFAAAARGDRTAGGSHAH